MTDALFRAERNAFVIHSVNRAHNRRGDESWLKESLDEETTRFIVVWRDQVLVRDHEMLQLGMLDAEAVGQLSSRCTGTAPDLVLLGELGGTLYFAVGMDEACDAVPNALNGIGEMLDLRRAAPGLDHKEGALAAHAKAMVHWLRQHRYCGLCGHPTEREEGGYLLRCQNSACGEVHFPRVDPAIIVLVTRGAYCLLGRQARWPKVRYSNVAGFVEPGESLETAVAREVREETGVELRSMSYHSSQPWPFPQSLMVGFTAEAASETIHLNDGELEDAAWYTREQIAEGLNAGTLGLPSTYSISFHLIEDWFDAGRSGKLRQILAASGAEEWR